MAYSYPEMQLGRVFGWSQACIIAHQIVHGLVGYTVSLCLFWVHLFVPALFQVTGFLLLYDAESPIGPLPGVPLKPAWLGSYRSPDQTPSERSEEDTTGHRSGCTVVLPSYEMFWGSRIHATPYRNTFKLLIIDFFFPKKYSRGCFAVPCIHLQTHDYHISILWKHTSYSFRPKISDLNLYSNPSDPY